MIVSSDYSLVTKANVSHFLIAANTMKAALIELILTSDPEENEDQNALFALRQTKRLIAHCNKVAEQGKADEHN